MGEVFRCKLLTPFQVPDTGQDTCMYLQYVMEQFLEKEQQLESPSGRLVGKSCDQLKWQQMPTCKTFDPFLTPWVQGNP